jgi:hypothetical protein
MKSEALLTELEALAERLGVQVKYESLGGQGVGLGGLCKVKGEWRAIIDRRASKGEQVAVLAHCLSGFDLEAIFLPPEVRQVMAQAAARARAAVLAQLDG